jgi:DNA adenine methylase
VFGLCGIPDSGRGFFILSNSRYIGSDQGHYDGYTQEDFDSLLTILEDIKGKFLLSSFKNRALAEFTKRNGWPALEYKMECSMANRYKNQRTKTGILTANFPLPG